MLVRANLRWAAALGLVGLSSCGSGVLTSPLDAHREVGVDGRQFTLDELQAIADDADLTEDQKRKRFRALGIEDVDLIDALLNL
ncbi:MAG: hypothetical protein C4547_13045 [Phycisphaerales bacterium]|nr:MAG: hypothetical protein C4547_13045 [Phycisphaerales bacterium]